MSASRDNNHWPKQGEQYALYTYSVSAKKWPLVQPCFKSHCAGCSGVCDVHSEVVPLYCKGKCMVLCGPSTSFDLDAWLKVCEKLLAVNQTPLRISCTPVNA